MCGHIFPKGAFTIWSFVCRRNTFEPNSEYDGQGHCLWRKRRPWDCHRWRVQGLTTRFPNGSNIYFRLQASGCCRSTLQPTMPLMPMSLWVSTNLGFWQIKKSEINLNILSNLKPKVKPAGGNSNKTQLLISCWLQVSLNDGWVDQEAAVCQGVDDAVRGAKVGWKKFQQLFAKMCDQDPGGW